MVMYDITVREAFRKGEWQSFNRVLNLLNTYDDTLINKKELYDRIMQMRPQGK